MPITEIINTEDWHQIASHTKVVSLIRKDVAPLWRDVDTKKKRVKGQLHVWNRLCKIEDSERLKRLEKLEVIEWKTMSWYDVQAVNEKFSFPVDNQNAFLSHWIV